MFLTALGLAWILGRQSGVDGMAIGLAAALALGLTLWWLGRRQGDGRSWLRLAPAAAAVAAGLLFLPVGNEGQAAASPLAGEKFSEAVARRGARVPQRPAPSVRLFSPPLGAATCTGQTRRDPWLSARRVRAFARRPGSPVLSRMLATGGDALTSRFLAAQGALSGSPAHTTCHYTRRNGPEILPQLLTVSRVV
jgi:hypothetical protein